jgi:drug/metabolite transporter (DMT)-like permease
LLQAKKGRQEDKVACCAEESITQSFETLSLKRVKQPKDDAKKGVTFYLISTILLSAQLYSNKMLFDTNPAVSVLQFTFVRGAVSLALGLLWSSGHLRADLIDHLDWATLPSLGFRCFQGATSVFISFLCVKFFSVATVGVVCSLTPLMVCLIAYFVLGERIKRAELFGIVFVVAAVSLVMLGQQDS